MNAALPARADWLIVERGVGAETCPNAAELEAQVDKIRARGLAPAGAHDPALEAARTEPYLLRFEREDEVLLAQLRPSASLANVRTLTAHASSCESLARAAAVALALLLDAASDPPPEAEAPSARALPQVTHSDPRVPDAARVRKSVALGAGALWGVTRLAAPALQGELGLWFGPFRGSLGVDVVPAHHERFGPGTLRTWLLVGAAKGCFAALSASRARFDLCTGLHLGVIHAQARGYTRNAQRREGWVALPLELASHVFFGPVAVSAGAGALFPFERPEFSVDGLGRVYRAWPVAALLSLRMVLAWPLFGADEKKK